MGKCRETKFNRETTGAQKERYKISKCMYNGKQITVSEYLKKPGVKTFESKLKALAYKSALCQSGGKSVYGDTYPPLREGHPTQQNRRCIYFETHVLPMDKNVEADYWNVFLGGKVGESTQSGECRRCLQSFSKYASNQVYCKHCKNYLDLEKKRNYYHRKKQSTNGL